MAYRVPMSVASGKGVSWLVDKAEQEGSVVLTSFDQALAVVMSAERADDMRGVFERAAGEIVASYVARAPDGDVFIEL